MSPDPYGVARDAAARLAAITGVDRHDVLAVLGSGWAPAADQLGAASHDVPMTDLPGFAEPTASGHPGRVRSVLVGDTRLLVMLGRTHLYEGLGTPAVVHPIRTAAAAGCTTAILTNGCGSLNPAWLPGTPVLICDHLNLTARSPLVGARFVDLTDLYSSRLRALCHELDPSLDEGVYAQLPGPHYETPAEVRMVGTLGGDLVGMSTALEAIAAREAGMEVLGVSLVTNLAAGLTGAPLDHADVLATGAASAERVGSLLAALVGRLSPPGVGHGVEGVSDGGGQPVDGAEERTTHDR